MKLGRDQVKFDGHGIACIFLILIYCLVIGNRPSYIGTDTETYIEIFLNMEGVRGLEPGFKYLTNLIKLFGSIEVYFFTITFLIIIVSNHLLRFGIDWKASILIYCFFISPFFHGHTLNILRQGLATSFIIFLILNKEFGNLRSLLLIFLATLFHVTGLVFGALAILARIIGIKFAFSIWLCGVLLSYMISSDSWLIHTFSSYIGSDYYSGYLASFNEGYNSGFKIKFLIFSTVLNVFAYILLMRLSRINTILMSYCDAEYIYKCYLIFNGTALIFLQMPYSDRWLNWSWSLLPFFILWSIEVIFLKHTKNIIMLILPLLAIVSSSSFYFQAISLNK
jgi:hypothetical protein